MRYIIINLFHKKVSVKIAILKIICSCHSYCQMVLNELFRSKAVISALLVQFAAINENFNYICIFFFRYRNQRKWNVIPLLCLYILKVDICLLVIYSLLLHQKLNSANINIKKYSPIKYFKTSKLNKQFHSSHKNHTTYLCLKKIWHMAE